MFIFCLSIMSLFQLNVLILGILVNSVLACKCYINDLYEVLELTDCSFKDFIKSLKEI